MSRSLILLLGLVLAAILAFICIRHHMQEIPVDIETRTYNVLQADNLTSVRIDTDGRDVTLTGIVEKERTKQRAGQIAKQVTGVRVVDNKITVTPPAIPEPDVVVTPELTVEDINNQCEQDLRKTLEEQTIQFASSSSTIDEASIDLLKRLAAIARNCPDSSIVIEGHTDSSGDAEVNVSLSQKRAQSVADYLKNTAELPQSITAKGFGSSQPVADNDTVEGRAKNRRIEFKVNTMESF